MNTDQYHTNPLPEEPDWRNWIRFRPLDTDPEVVYARFQRRLAEESGWIAGWKKGVSPVWKYISIAACVAFLAALSVILSMGREGSVPGYLEVTAAAGARTRLVLPDSTVVCLNGGARIRYPQFFGPKERSVEFWGEGFFEVNKEADRPFIVRLDGMHLKVLGTVFNIFDDPVGETIETTLLQGKVALFADTNETDTADLILRPDQQARFHKKSGKMELQTVDPHFYTAWKTGIFRFENKTLEEIGSVLERAFQVKIRIADERMKKVHLTASFKEGESLDTILSVLQISARYTYRKENGIIRISEK